MGAGWDLWIFWSGELRLEQEGSCELKSRGLGGGYEPEAGLQPGLLL